VVPAKMVFKVSVEVEDVRTRNAHKATMQANAAAICGAGAACSHHFDITQRHHSGATARL